MAAAWFVPDEAAPGSAGRGRRAECSAATLVGVRAAPVDGE